MKCNKCGYVSFDYLSECKKCGVSLEATREGLGFGTAKPNVPSFLGALLKDYVKPPEEPAAEEPESGFSFDFADEFDPGEIQMEDSQDEKSLSPSRQDPAFSALEAGLGMEPSSDFGDLANRGGPGTPKENAEAEDFALLDITDEEMDLLMADSDDVKTGKSGQSMNKSPQANPADEIVLTPSMENEELNIGSWEETRSTKDDAERLIPKFDVSALPGLSDRPVPSEPETYGDGVEKITVEDDGLEISLSEKDLKTLLADLEVASQKKEESKD